MHVGDLSANRALNGLTCSRERESTVLKNGQVVTKEAIVAALEGSNQTATLRQLGSRIHALLLKHLLRCESRGRLELSHRSAPMLDSHLSMDMCRYTFNTVGGLRLKRDLTEYAGAISSFGLSDAGLATQFDTLCTLANLFIVVPDRCSFRLYPPNMPQLREPSRTDVFLLVPGSAGGGGCAVCRLWWARAR